jgi:CRP/FNR family transcriptional regulator
MGSFLGITLETVSRTLSRFQAKGLIDANGKLIQILDFDGLRAI